MWLVVLVVYGVGALITGGMVADKYAREANKAHSEQSAQATQSTSR